MSMPLCVRILGSPAFSGRLAARLAGRLAVRDDAALCLCDPAAPRPPRVAVVVVAPTSAEAGAVLAASPELADAVAETVTDEEFFARLARAAHRPGPLDHRRVLDEQLALIRDLTTSQDLPALPLRIVQKLAKSAGIERCSIMLFDETEVTPTRGTVVAASDQPNVQALRIQLEGYPEIREAIRTRAPVIVRDAALEPLLHPVREQLGRAGIGAMAVFPLHVDDQLLGVLLLRARAPFEHPDSIALASTAAIAATIAVRHGRLVKAAVDETARELRRYESFISHLSDGVAVLDRSGVMMLLNPAGAAILGWPDEFRGRRLLDVAPPADPFAAQLLFREIGRGARVLNADLDLILRDGRRVVLAVSAGQLQWPESHAILSFRDVTEQRAVEVELRRTRDFLERLIDASIDAIVAADLDGRILVFNRAAEQLFGVSNEEARSSLHVRELYPEGGAREVMRLLRVSPTSQIEAVRAYGRTRADELVPIELSAALVRVGAKPVASVGLMRDLRERVRVESELARTRARLLDVEKQGAITALAGATAHELNQPLTVILGYVELLRRKADEKNNKALEAIGSEAERMAQIVKRIARLTRIETVSYPGEKQIADIERSSEPRGPPVIRR